MELRVGDRDSAFPITTISCGCVGCSGTMGLEMTELMEPAVDAGILFGTSATEGRDVGEMTEVEMVGEDIEFVGSDWVLSGFFKASGRLMKSNGETLLLAVFASSLSERGIVLVRLTCGFRTTVGRLPWASISLMPGSSLGITWAPFSSNGALAVTGLRVTVWWPSLSVSPLKMTPVPAPESIGLPLSSSGWELVRIPRCCWE